MISYGIFESALVKSHALTEICTLPNSKSIQLDTMLRRRWIGEGMHSTCFKKL